MKRRVESSHYDVRFEIEVTLSTGKTLLFTSKSKPAHWDLRELRQGLVNHVSDQVNNLKTQYNIDFGQLRVYRVSVRSERITETRESRKFDSEVKS